MSRLVAEFESAGAMMAGARRAHEKGFMPLDALSPYPMPELDAFLPPSKPTIRVPMAIAGFGTALFAFAFQSWTAVYAYPFNSGGRPLFSWPIFLLVPFEVGVLAAGVAGMIALFVHCGLPRLHHPIFEVGGIERASQDRFFLVLDRPPDAEENAPDADYSTLKALLLGAGALQISEAGA